MMLFIEHWHCFIKKFNTKIVKSKHNQVMFWLQSVKVVQKIVTWNMLFAPCSTYWTLASGGEDQVGMSDAMIDGKIPWVVPWLGRSFSRLVHTLWHARAKLESCTGLPTHPATTSHMSRAKSWDKWWTKSTFWAQATALCAPAHPPGTYSKLFDKPIRAGVYMHCLSYGYARGVAFMDEPPCACFMWETCHGSGPEP